MYLLVLWLGCFYFGLLLQQLATESLFSIYLQIDFTTKCTERVKRKTRQKNTTESLERVCTTTSASGMKLLLLHVSTVYNKDVCARWLGLLSGRLWLQPPIAESFAPHQHGTAWPRMAWHCTIPKAAFHCTLHGPAWHGLAHYRSIPMGAAG